MKFDELRTWIRSYAVFKKMGGTCGCWNEQFISDDFMSLCKDNEVFKLNVKWPVDERKKGTWHDFFCSDKSLYWPQ